MDSKRLDVRPTPTSAIRAMRRPVELSRSRLPLRASRFLRARPVSDYLGEGERCRHVEKLHWMFVARNVFQTLAVSMVTSVLSWGFSLLSLGIWQIQLIMWLGAVGHVGRTGWRILRWNAERVIVTNRRLICTQGVILRRARTWHLPGITNVDFDEQSVAGRMFGYGTLRVESAGQHNDGADREFIHFLRDPAYVAGMLCPHLVSGVL